MAPVILAYPRSVLIVDEQSRPPFMNNLRGNFYTLFFFLLLLSLFFFLFYDETCSRGPMLRTELTARRRQIEEDEDEFLNVSRVPLNITSIV